MSDATMFPSSSPRFGLPLLFAGQAQKEVFVNESLSLTDALLHCAIEGEATSPPSTPTDGTAWLVGTSATGEWLGKDGLLACRQSANWLYVMPRDGMKVFDRSRVQWRTFAGAWKFPSAPAEPTGGSVVDTQSRSAIRDLIAALRLAGIFPYS